MASPSLRCLVIPFVITSVALGACMPKSESPTVTVAPVEEGTSEDALADPTEATRTAVADSAPSASTPTVAHLDASAAAELLKQGRDIVILDVRTADEYEEGRISDSARNIDFRSEDFRQQIEKLDRSVPYLVHCRSGGRSTQSLEVFEELEFREIYHLDGGLMGWEDAGLPIVE